MTCHSKCYACIDCDQNRTSGIEARGKTVTFRQLFIAEKRTRGDVEIHLPRAEADCANDNTQLRCEADHSTGLVIDWSRGDCSAIFGDFTFGGRHAVV
jgi:hypothetical protein